MNETNSPAPTPLWRKLIEGCGTETDRRNSRVFTAWCLAWAICMTGATALIEFVDSMPQALAWAIALTPNIFAIGALFAFLKSLRMTDELQRRIQLEGLAIGFGVGWFVALGWLVLESAGAPDLSANSLVLIMTAGWIAGTLFAVRRYR